MTPADRGKERFLPFAFGVVALAALVGCTFVCVGFRPTLERLLDVLALVVLAAMVSTAVSATIGVSSLCAGGVQPWSSFGSLWLEWWIGDAMGDLIVAPLVLVWVSLPPRSWALRYALEGAALLTGPIFISFVVFTVPFSKAVAERLLPYQIFPFVVWGALRFRQIGAVTVTFVAASLATWNTVQGRGPFVLETARESLIMLQLFQGVVAISGLLLAAAIRERDSALRRAAKEYEHVRSSEERLRLALQAARMGVWDWDIATGEVHWSHELESRAGLGEGSFPGTFEDFLRVVHPDDQPRLQEAIQSALTGDGNYELELRTLVVDGSVRWSIALGTVLRDEHGVPVRMVGVALDMTERRHLEDELREHARQLADADRRKDEFLAMLAHELRNPLAPLSNALHLLHVEGADRTRFLEMADRQVRLLARLVDDLLDVSRITRGQITLRKEPVLLTEVVNQAVDAVRQVIDSRGQALTVSLPPQGLRLEADPARLSQVFANLLSNAAKYTAPGGSVWLTAEPVADEIVIRVRDSGAGIAPELLPHIFDLFVQADVSLERAHGGLGIGLTVVKRLVEMHGGSVEAHSAGIGQGSEFIVRLRCVPVPASVRSEHEATALSTTMGALRVLLVEDNKDSAETLADILELWGHEVRMAFDGASAIEIAERFEPDVIVSDIGLPGMDGYEVARRLRAQPSFGRVVLIALSGYGGDDDKRRALEAGFDHHIVKPPDLTLLAELLGRVARSAAERVMRTVH